MAHIQEKARASNAVSSLRDGSDLASEDRVIHFTEVKCPAHTTEKKLVAKIDARLIPILVLVYILAFLDRVNISNALTLGLQKDLGLQNLEPNIALAIFFVPYVLLEIPSNWLMKLVGPHVWISGCITFFGLFMLGQGFVKSYSALLATRFFLGMAEAGLFPGCFYLISFYYKRDESQQRFTWFFNAATIASAFGSLIASGIAKMDGVHHLAAWRWIFIIEGAVTVAFGMIAYFVIVDFPATAKWLREDERDFVLARVAADRSVDAEPITAKGIGRFFLSTKRAIGGFMYFGTLIPLYSFTYFAPTIIKELGLSTVQTQLHTVPPFAVAIVFSLTISYISDKAKMRFPFLIFCILMAIAGVAMLQGIHRRDFPSQYAALFLVVIGTFSAGPLIICWCTMNLRGHLDRAVGTAWIIGFGNIGGLIATFTLPAKDAPYYRSGYAICQAGACLGAATTVIYFITCLKENRRLKARGETDLNML